MSKQAKTECNAHPMGCRCEVINAARRDHVRKLCLLMLDDHRPGFAAYSCLLADLQSLYPNVTQHELLRALDYLELKGLLTITKVYGRPDQVRLTCEGIDWVDERPPVNARGF